MIVVIASGKGGTGKTTITAALAHLASQEASVVMVDADVDAANLGLLLDPTVCQERQFVGGKLAVIDAQRCTLCGACVEVCRFDAVRPLPAADGGEGYGVDGPACEGCGACFYRCPVDAIRLEDQRAGSWFRSDTRFGPLFHAHLFAGQENSGKLVTLVRQQARQWALDAKAGLVLVDGPPGIGCPVIAACAGMDLALHVAEPTLSGVHDLARVVETAAHFGVPSLVVINKADLNESRCNEIAAFCAAREIPLVGHVPYDAAVVEAMVGGKPVTEWAGGALPATLRAAWAGVKAALWAR